MWYIQKKFELEAIEMTTIDDKSAVVEDALFQFNERNMSVPQQLTEANELLKSINRRLEDCALEWQANISRKQWKIFNSKANGGNSTGQSLLGRTYFTEKTLDEAFQHLLSCNKIFSEYLKNFIELLRGKESCMNTKEMCNMESQCNMSETYTELRNTDIDMTRLLSLDNCCMHVEGNIPSYIKNILNIKSSFTDVIKAKVNFDTKFLGFEAVLHKATSKTNNPACPCDYCSVLTTTSCNENKKLRNMTVNPRRKTIRKSKRLNRSTKSLSTKKQRGRRTIVIRDAGDQLPLSTSIC